jgi:hypothetical protein
VAERGDDGRWWRRPGASRGGGGGVVKRWWGRCHLPCPLTGRWINRGGDSEVRVSGCRGGTASARLEGVGGRRWTGGGRRGGGPVTGRARGWTAPEVDEEAASNDNSDSKSKSADEPRGGRRQDHTLGEQTTCHGIGRSHQKQSYVNPVLL